MKKRSSQAKKCSVCSEPMKKNGHHPSGKQRWYCTSCKLSDITMYHCHARQAQQLDQFVTWLTDTLPARAQELNPRTFRRHYSWCWHIRPQWERTGEVHDQILIDAKHLSHGWVVLIARTREYVIGYQLATHESKEAYQALLSRFPAPRVVVTDGAKGSLSAIKNTWPDTRIQRCLIHIQRNITTITTTRPRLIQHQALRRLGQELLRVNTPEQAIAWINHLARFNETFRAWLDEKTYRDHVPPNQIPAFARRNKTWWYTHKPT